jgi:hypothetical protein
VFFYLPRGRGLLPILATILSYEADLAGEWREDGTWDRASSSGEAFTKDVLEIFAGHESSFRRRSLCGLKRNRWSLAGACCCTRSHRDLAQMNNSVDNKKDREDDFHK